MYEQDYIMRMINNLVRVLSKVIFNRDVPVYEISHEGEYEQSDDLHKNLLALLSAGKINEAEDMLFEDFNPRNKKHLMLALDFYRRLNDLDDEYLKENNFSREEIEEGLRDIAEIAGIETYEI